MTVLIIMGILGAIAAPSLLSKQAMRSGVNSTVTLLKTANLTARANSGNPYRITVVSKNIGDEIQYNFKVESEISGTCELPRDPGDAPTWRHDPSKDLFLPVGMIVANFPDVGITNGICFNSKGETYRGVSNTIPITFEIEDTTQQSIARRAVFTVSAVGDITFKTYGTSGELPKGNDGVNGALN
jgi:hypothetical protein